MIQTSLFPTIVPERDLNLPVEVPLGYIPRTPHWVLVRAKGRRISDHPKWHLVKVLTRNGSVLARCGHMGTQVTEGIPDGAMILGCPACLDAPER
jgi:hypothetical protein